MRVELRGVGKAEREQALPVTNLVFESGQATLGFAETEQRPTVLGLLASGRMHADTGSILIDGETDAAALRRHVALVDAPDVSAPEPNVSVAAAVAEQLMFAGRRAGYSAAHLWLEELKVDDAARRPFGNLEPARRLRLLCELAALRVRVEGLVLVSPDRHGGDPRVWWKLASEFAERGYAVLVIAGEASRRALRVEVDEPDAPVDADTDVLPPAETAT